jgi:hypothetical protein
MFTLQLGYCGDTIDDGSGCGVAVAMAGMKDVLRGAATHASPEATWVRAAKIGKGVDGKVRWLAGGLVALHCLLGGGSKCTGHGGDVIGRNGGGGNNGGDRRENRSKAVNGSRWVPSRGKGRYGRVNREGGGNSSGFEAAGEGALDELLLGSDTSIMADSNNAESVKGCKLEGASSLGGKVGRGVVKV